MLLHFILSAGDRVLFGRARDHGVLWRRADDDVLCYGTHNGVLRDARDVVLGAARHVLCAHFPGTNGVLRLLSVVVAPRRG
jgi:hypothetical protein